ncbi:hypothetical protein GVAV_002986 [Gurleya vavrai]
MNESLENFNVSKEKHNFYENKNNHVWESSENLIINKKYFSGRRNRPFFERENDDFKNQEFNKNNNTFKSQKEFKNFDLMAKKQKLNLIEAMKKDNDIFKNNFYINANNQININNKKNISNFKTDKFNAEDIQKHYNDCIKNSNLTKRKYEISSELINFNNEKIMQTRIHESSPNKIFDQNHPKKQKTNLLESNFNISLEEYKRQIRFKCSDLNKNLPIKSVKENNTINSKINTNKIKKNNIDEVSIEELKNAFDRQKSNNKNSKYELLNKRNNSHNKELIFKENGEKILFSQKNLSSYNKTEKNILEKRNKSATPINCDEKDAIIPTNCDEKDALLFLDFIKKMNEDIENKNVQNKDVNGEFCEIFTCRFCNMKYTYRRCLINHIKKMHVKN